MNINRIFLVFLISLISAFGAAAQDILARHTVSRGETVTQIAQKYKITPHDIYQVNPTAKNGIKENDILLIPAKNTGKTAEPVTAKVPVSAPQQTSVSTTHVVKSKETMFGIAKQYGISVDDLKNANPILSEGLKVGQTIKIQSNPSINVTTTTIRTVKSDSGITSGNPITHIVQSKETKFGIAKKYGITVAELERQNPGIVQSLPVGYKLTIRSSGAELPSTSTTVTQSNSVTPVESTVKKTPYANYEVKPKETMFSLTQMFGITEIELVALNPGLKDGVRAGMILKVPGRGSMIPQELPKNDDLAKTISREKKELVMLLPFNAARIQGDTLKSLAERLKKDAFLNMTLDFYSGALMAIDSAKTLGINVDVKIYDSAESKASSAVADIVSSKNLSKADAVIGPFYQQYAEKVAEMLATDNVPVISPMSKEAGKPMPNLFQAMPSEEIGKRAIFDYMMSKNGNIIVISDPKRAANREFIKANYPGARLAELEENGGLNADNLKAMFVKDRTNYVVIDSERTGMILSTTNLLLNELANYTIQLAIIEPNETLDFEEISMKRLTILKLLYPSMTRENHSAEAVAFENAYKRENKVFPSQYAVRGFDVTFDTLLRLAQDRNFSETASADPTERIESKFQYQKDTEGYVNKGVYILQYNEDLTVSEAQ